MYLNNAETKLAFYQDLQCDHCGAKVVAPSEEALFSGEQQEPSDVKMHDSKEDEENQS